MFYPDENLRLLGALTGALTTGSTHDGLNVKPSTYFASSFGNIRVAEPTVIGDLINTYGFNSVEWDRRLVGSATSSFDADLSANIIRVTGSASGSSACLRTNTYFRYRAGQDLRLKQTVHVSGGVHVSQSIDWGFFDDSDGIMWRRSSGTTKIVVRSSTTGTPTETSVEQASWNVDRMDGSGSSLVALDTSLQNIYETDFQWLGAGSIRSFVNGHLVNVIENSNLRARPYMRTARLPLSYEVKNYGVADSGSLHQVCASVEIVGRDSAPSRETFGTANDADINVTTTGRPIMSIRPAASFMGETNRTTVLPALLNLSVESSVPSRVAFRVIVNGTLTSASFGAPYSDSSIERDVSATAVTGGLLIIRSFLSSVSDSKELSLVDLFNAASRKLRQSAFTGSLDTMTIFAQNISAGTSNVRASVTWHEVR